MIASQRWTLHPLWTWRVIRESPAWNQREAVGVQIHRGHAVSADEIERLVSEHDSVRIR